MPGREGLAGLRVLGFESRRGGEMERLIAAHGGLARVVPALREVPAGWEPALDRLGEDLLAGRCDLLVLLTGTGTRLLLESLAARHPAADLVAALRRVPVAARGPKPAAVLREWGLAPTLVAPAPATGRDLLEAVAGRFSLAGRRVAVQEYGQPNPALLAGLRALGAEVVPVAVYRWVLPEDTGPLRRAVRAVVGGEADVLLFTTGVQAVHVAQVAATEGLAAPLREALARVVVGSVGPSTTRAVQAQGWPVDLEPPQARLGLLVREAALRGPALLAAKRGAAGEREGGGAGGPR